MPRYIDAIKLIKEFQALPCCPNGYSDEYDKARIFAMIDNQPIADVIEVNYAYNEHEDTPSLFRCSRCRWECRDTIPCSVPIFKYCPWCGAKIRRKEKTDD